MNSFKDAGCISFKSRKEASTFCIAETGIFEKRGQQEILLEAGS